MSYSEGLKVCDDGLMERVIGAAICVHRELGPGLLESAYEAALMVELERNDIAAKSQVEVPVIYRGSSLGVGFRADVVVEDSLLLELKSVEEFNKIHLAQVINYLKLLKFKKGLLLNFNKRVLKDGIKRISI